MPEEKKDNDVIDQLVNGQGVKAQPAPGQQEGVKDARPATGQGVSDSAGVQRDAAILADGTSPDKDVPYKIFKEANEAKKAAEEAQQVAERQAQLARDQMALMQVNQTQAQQPVSSYEQALRDCNLIGEEYLSQEQQIQLNARKEQLDAVRLMQQQTAFSSQQFMQSHPDFGQVAGQVNPVTGQFMASAELQKILTEKPYLQASCNTAQGAYEIVIQERKLAKLNAAVEQHQAQQQIDTKLAPMSAAAVGGGAIDRTAGEISQSAGAKEVKELEQRVKAGEFDE